jgi:pantothenate kinase type III
LTGVAVLTLDLGNTSASVALVDRGGAHLLASMPVGDLDGAALEACLQRSAPRPTRAAVSAVGDPATERRVCGALEVLGLDVSCNPDPGMELRIDHPETCGRDRLYAALGAVEGIPEFYDPDGLVVIDAGTAVTVDAVSLSPLAFLGGAIAPGPGTLAASLSQAGARLPEFAVRPDVNALGRSTEEALRAGVVVGFRGAVRDLCATIAAEAFGPTATVAAVLTGGARGFARAGVAAGLKGAPREEPLLVHIGLAAALNP